jgi:hypothetical protein
MENSNAPWVGSTLGVGSSDGSEESWLGEADGDGIDDGEPVQAATSSTRAMAPLAVKRAVIADMGITTDNGPLNAAQRLRDDRAMSSTPCLPRVLRR